MGSIFKVIALLLILVSASLGQPHEGSPSIQDGNSLKEYCGHGHSYSEGKLAIIRQGMCLGYIKGSSGRGGCGPGLAERSRYPRYEGTSLLL